MPQRIATVTLVIPDYDAAIDFYVGVLGFRLIEDTPLHTDKRWVLVGPDGDRGARLLLAKAATAAQRAVVGVQTGGRVFLFLGTDDFARDHHRLTCAGVSFLESPRPEPYGTVAVFQDPFGNRWDLIEPRSDRPQSAGAGPTDGPG